MSAIVLQVLATQACGNVCFWHVSAPVSALHWRGSHRLQQSALSKHGAVVVTAQVESQVDERVCHPQLGRLHKRNMWWRQSNPSASSIRNLKLQAEKILCRRVSESLLSNQAVACRVSNQAVAYRVDLHVVLPWMKKFFCSCFLTISWRPIMAIIIMWWMTSL